MHASRLRVLILGGSSEAFALAEALSARPDVEVVTSMAGRTKDPKLPRGDVRLGGFGGPEGLADHLRDNGFTALIDATHPFARRMTANAARAAADAGVPVLHFWRAEWQQVPGDRWIEVDDMTAAAAAVPAGASPAFLTVGRTELGPFRARPDIHMLARIIDPVDDGDWPPHFSFIHERGPFSYDHDRTLLVERKIRAVITKNSGGEGARGKIDAARDLGLPVVMVRRPPPPSGRVVETPAEALEWLGRFVNGAGRAPAAPEHA